MTRPAPSKNCLHCGTVTGLGARFRYCSVNCQIWSRVEVRGENDCWLWTGAKNSNGYGQVRTAEGTFYVHRLAFATLNGDPGELDVCHRCDTPLCCNPNHYFLGTQAENMADMARKGRSGRAGNGRGDESPNSKVTTEVVREIRRLVEAGEASQYELAERFGIKQPTVNCIVKRRTWKHVA